LLNRLKGGIIKEAVFLALDNVSHTQASMDEAKNYLSASLPSGSIVLLTSRTKETLLCVRPYVDEGNCLEMPKLDVEEARSLFCKSSNLELTSEVDEGLIMRCVERCHFKKNDGSGISHYHPLTLDVLGKQLGCIDSREWRAQLDKIDEDIFNMSKETDHPIFSILRRSFDAVSKEDQLLFMDVVPFTWSRSYLPWKFSSQRSCHELSMFEWLGMVHRRSADDVIRGVSSILHDSHHYFVILHLLLQFCISLLIWDKQIGVSCSVCPNSKAVQAPFNQCKDLLLCMAPRMMWLL
jgi:hypothetical protein